MQASRWLNFRWRGVLIAVGMIGGWALLMALTLGVLPGSSWGLTLLPLAVAANAVAFTGLFIVGHDAIHGTVAPSYPHLGRALGRLALGLYGGFDFGVMAAAHHAHHRHPGTERDPDFVEGGPLRWYLGFMRRHATWRQPATFVTSGVLASAAGVPLLWWALLWPLPALLASLQLFVFGTWLPHRGGTLPFEDDHRARSNSYPTWLSLLTCFHFGYHLEHHRHPYVPWWRLPELRRLTGATGRRIP